MYRLKGMSVRQIKFSPSHSVEFSNVGYAPRMYELTSIAHQISTLGIILNMQCETNDAHVMLNYLFKFRRNGSFGERVGDVGQYQQWRVVVMAAKQRKVIFLFLLFEAYQVYFHFYGIVSHSSYVHERNFKALLCLYWGIWTGPFQALICWKWRNASRLLRIVQNFPRLCQRVKFVACSASLATVFEWLLFLMLCGKTTEYVDWMVLMHRSEQLRGLGADSHAAVKMWVTTWPP